MIRRRVWRGALVGLAATVLLARSGRTETLCLALAGSGGQVVYPVLLGDEVNLTFAHSIYGSQIEEQFRVGRRGFESVKLRYAELRLVEFYGHESARQENGWWIVDNQGHEIPALDLRVSQAASMRIAFGAHTIALGDRASGDGWARLIVGACPSITHD